MYFFDHHAVCPDRDKCIQPVHLLCEHDKQGRTHHLTMIRDMSGGPEVCAYCKRTAFSIRWVRAAEIEGEKK